MLQDDIINLMPDELLVILLKYLPLETLLVCERVCRRWRRLARDLDVWRHLVLVCGEKIQGNTMSPNIISSYGHCVRCLRIYDIKNSSVTQAILEKCLNVISLDLFRCRINKSFEQNVVRWKKLKKLSLYDCHLDQSTEFSVQFDQFRNLRHLALSHFGLNITNRNSLLVCPNLSHIYIHKVKELEVEYIEELIKSKKNILVTLHMYGDRSVDDQCMELLAECPLLKDLAILRCQNLTDSGLFAVTKMKRIEHLAIWENTSFSERGIMHALKSSSIKTLKSLSLCEIKNVSPVVIDFISHSFKALDSLDLLL